METFCFGASRDGVSPHAGAFVVPLKRIRCSECSTAYVVWGNQSAPEEQKELAIALLNELIGRSHPNHKVILCGSVTLDELRQRLGRKAATGAS